MLDLLSIKNSSLFKNPKVISFIRNTSFQSIASITTAIITFLQTIVLGKYLLVNNYGILALIITYVQFINRFFCFNSWEFVTKYAAQSIAKNNINQYYATLKLGYLLEFITGILAFSVSILLLPIASEYFFHGKHQIKLILLFAFTLFFSNMDNTSNGVLRVHDKFKWIATRDLIIGSLKLLSFLAVLVYTPLGLQGIILVYLVTAIISCITNVFLISFLTKTNLFRAIKKASFYHLADKFSEIKRFILNTYCSASLSMFLGYSDILVLGYFCQPYDVGIYKMSKNFINMINRLIEPFYLVVFPELSRITATEVEYFKKYIKTISAILTIFLMPIIFIVFISMPLLIRYTVGNTFMQSILPARIMLLGSMVAGLCFWSRPAILAVNRPHIPNIINFINVIIFLFLSILLIPHLSYIGMAIIYVIVTLFGNTSVSYIAYYSEKVVE